MNVSAQEVFVLRRNATGIGSSPTAFPTQVRMVRPRIKETIATLSTLDRQLYATGMFLGAFATP